VLRSRHHGDRRQLWFIPAVAAGLAGWLAGWLPACLPVVLAGSAQAGRQVAWILRPGLDLTDFAFFGRNLFYSTSVATALIILAVLAGAVLAGIGLSRLDGRIAVVTVLVIAILSAGDQQVIREPGAHNWPSYPVGLGGYYVDYAA
jgi:hypothetical protein